MRLRDFVKHCISRLLRRLTLWLESSWARNVGVYLLEKKPEFHTLVAVAVFINLTANLLVSFLAGTDYHKLYLVSGALFEFLAAICYLRVAIAAGQIWEDMRSRRARTVSENIRDFLRLDSQKKLVGEVSLRGILALSFCVIGLLSTFVGLLSSGSSGPPGDISDHASSAQLFFRTFYVHSLEFGDRLAKSMTHLAQPIANGVVAGALYGLVALGFGLVYSTWRFFHFAHGALLAVGAYFAYSFTVRIGLTPFIAVPGAVFCTCLLGLVIAVSIYRPLRSVGSTSLQLLVASLGLSVILGAALSILFGDDALTIRSTASHEGHMLLGAVVTSTQATTVLVSCALTATITGFLHFTRLGKTIRAVADDPELAEIDGVRVDCVLQIVFVAGTALAAIAGVLAAYDTGLIPSMGFRLLMIGVVAAVVGGIGSVMGAVLGGLFLGLAQNLGILWLPTQWQDGIVFVVLILFLLVRPHGIFGKSLKASAV